MCIRDRVRDGVTPACYSYSNFIFRHLKKRDYTTNACIGGRVSKARLAEYEADVERLEKDPWYAGADNARY